MKEIRLKGGEIVLVDDDVFEWASKLKWYLNKTKRNRIGYAITHVWRNGKRTSGYLHRMIVEVAPGMQVDHVNQNSLDNRRENLRPASVIQNMKNFPKRNGTASRFKGVTWHRHMKRWQAKIGSGNRRIHLGSYLTEEEAAAAYNEAAMKFHGEFAGLNEVPHV